jgi:hypothetical protein
MIPLLQKPDDIIIEEDEKGRHFFFIAEGKCIITHRHFPLSPS